MLTEWSKRENERDKEKRREERERERKMRKSGQQENERESRARLAAESGSQFLFRRDAVNSDSAIRSACVRELASSWALAPSVPRT